MLTYDPEKHLYAWHGAPVPSLSRLMDELGWGRADDLSWIKENRPEVLELARIRGEQVHEAIERYLRGDAGFVASLSEASAPYFDSFLAAADSLPLTQEGVSELPVGGWCGYGVTPDRVEPEAILEFKATAKIHPATRIQLTGQAYALRAYEKERIIVHLQKTGKRAKVTYESEKARLWDLWKHDLDKVAWKEEVGWR